MNAQAIVSAVRQLPSPSPAISRLLELLQDPEGSHEEVIDVVKQDAVLTAKVLQRCNAAAEYRTQPVGSVNQAVFLLGYRKIFQMVMSLSFGNTLQRGLPGYALEPGDLWRHSLLTALLSESLAAQSTLTVLPSIAYTAALVHDIGKTVLDQVLDPQLLEAVRREAESGDTTWLLAEQTVLRTDHSEVGACLLKRWNFPENIIEAVEHHHQPIIAPQPQLSALVHVANGLALDVDQGSPQHSPAPQGSTAEAVGLNLEHIARSLMAASDRLQEIEQLAAVA